MIQLICNYLLVFAVHSQHPHGVAGKSTGFLHHDETCRISSAERKHQTVKLCNSRMQGTRATDSLSEQQQPPSYLSKKHECAFVVSTKTLEKHHAMLAAIEMVTGRRNQLL